MVRCVNFQGLKESGYHVVCGYSRCEFDDEAIVKMTPDTQKHIGGNADVLRHRIGIGKYRPLLLVKLCGGLPIVQRLKLPQSYALATRDRSVLLRFIGCAV